jgi:hypothetical protein
VKAVKYVVVGLALMLLAGCVYGEYDSGPDFDRGHSAFRDQDNGPDRNATQERGDYQYRPY